MLPTLDSIEILGYRSEPRLGSARKNDRPMSIPTNSSFYTPSKQNLKIRVPSLINLNDGGPQWEINWSNLSS
jgi:hypothetical protein